MPFSSLSNCTSHNAMLLPDLPVTTERERERLRQKAPLLWHLALRPQGARAASALLTVMAGEETGVEG